jgi:hypothetical protein
MRHQVADGAAAAHRARRGYAPDWHPILSAVEDREHPGQWYLVAQFGRCYGIVRLITIGPERGYRALTWADSPEDRRLIGYYRTLRAACAATHRVFLASHGQQGGPNAPGPTRNS